MQTAKIFKNGQSQAVRLPKEFRLTGKVVRIFHMGRAVVLQPINESNTWMDIYNEMSELKDFMETREDLPPQERESV